MLQWLVGRREVAAGDASDRFAEQPAQMSSTSVTTEFRFSTSVFITWRRLKARSFCVSFAARLPASTIWFRSDCRGSERVACRRSRLGPLPGNAAARHGSSFVPVAAPLDPPRDR